MCITGNLGSSFLDAINPHPLPSPPHPPFYRWPANAVNEEVKINMRLFFFICPFFGCFLISYLFLSSLAFYSFLRFVIFPFSISVFCLQANETQELEELKKSKEQMETRLNIQISSLNENLAAARTEAEKFQQETREAGEKLADAEKRNDDLQGEIAGKGFCDKSFSWGLLTRKLWHIED